MRDANQTTVKARDLDGTTVTVLATFVDADGIERATIRKARKVETVPTSWLTYLSW